MAGDRQINQFSVSNVADTDIFHTKEATGEDTRTTFKAMADEILSRVPPEKKHSYFPETSTYKDTDMYRLERATGEYERTTYASLTLAIKKALYPVGSIYFNIASSESPSTLLGFGTWSKIEGRFLIGQGTAFPTLGATGGSFEHGHGSTLSIAAAGGHSHTATAAGGHSHTTGSAGSHSHSMTSNGGHSHSMGSAGNHDHSASTGWNGSHTHTVSLAGWGTYQVDGRFPESSYQSSLDSWKGKLVTHSGKNEGSENLESLALADNSRSSESNGYHNHSISSEGAHTHSLGSNGAHTHSIYTTGSHTHSVSTVADHSHTISSVADHTHTLSGGVSSTNAPQPYIVVTIWQRVA